MTATDEFPQVVAQRPDQFLIQTGPQRGRILDRRGYHPEMFLPSLVARGYWTLVTMTVAEAEQVMESESSHDIGPDSDD